MHFPQSLQPLVKLHMIQGSAKPKDLDAYLL